MRRRLSIGDLRAAWWAYRCLRDVRRRLADGYTDVRVAPPALPTSAVRGVEGLLRRAQPSCLEAALVRQRWLRAHGVLCDVVIGVTAPRDGFKAHAWLDEAHNIAPRQPWYELTRVPA
jgi:hypothetical protein